MKAKERVRLSPGGPTYVVVRVNDCAAYLRQTGTERLVRIPAKVDGEGKVLVPAREFTAGADGGTLAVSPFAAVERVVGDGLQEAGPSLGRSSDAADGA